jgi:hypothetical protein
MELLNKSLQGLPLGSDAHSKISQIVQTLVKIAPPSQQAQGVQKSQLQSLIQNAGRNAMLSQVMGSLGAGGAQQPGGGAAPSGPPPSPMMGG